MTRRTRDANRAPAPPRCPPASGPVHPARAAEAAQRWVAGIEPFPLFCAYHLGITRDHRCRFQNAHEVAAAFEVDVETLQRALRCYGLDPDTLIHSDFDLAGAQADVQVSPPGVDLIALARMHYDALLVSLPQARDWQSELAAAEAENEEIFGTR